MYRSPLHLRTGAKGRKVLLSASDKEIVDSASASSVSTCATAAKPDKPTMSKSTMSADKSASGLDLALVESCVTKHLSSGIVFDSLVAKLTVELQRVVEAAVSSAIAPLTEQMVKLREEVTGLNNRVAELEERLSVRTDELEQYQRRNNIRIFGVAEREKENTDDLVIQICRDQLGLDITADALCRTHRVGKQPAPAADGTRRHRPIIAKFISYRDRRRVFGAKRQLKGSGITIREDLTARRHSLFKMAAERFGLKNTWTQDGRVLWIDGRGQRGAATRCAELSGTVHG